MSNPLITNVDIYGVTLSDYKTKTVTVELGQNIVAGEVLGINTSTGEYKTCDSTAVDGSQYARAVAFYDVDATLSALNTTVLLASDLDSSKLIFSNIADTLDTVPAGSTDSYYTQLRDFNLYAENTNNLYNEDNQ